jgi:hypothetical protein
MINWLQKQGGYTSNGREITNIINIKLIKTLRYFFLIFHPKIIFLGLTWQEKSELEKLRVEIKKYRDFEGVKEEKNQSENESGDVINLFIYL